jgi:hypothetical protein
VAARSCSWGARAYGGSSEAAGPRRGGGGEPWPPAGPGDGEAARASACASGEPEKCGDRR